MRLWLWFTVACGAGFWAGWLAGGAGSFPVVAGCWLAATGAGALWTFLRTRRGR